jgi:hypothetical protein
MAGDEKTTKPVRKEDFGDVDVVQIEHQDGTIDYIDAQAIGGDLSQMPPGYFHSVQFIGTVTVSSSIVQMNRKRLLMLHRRFAVPVSALT